MVKKTLLLLINTLLICTLTLATPTHAGIGEKITATKEWCKEKWEKTTWKQIVVVSTGAITAAAAAILAYRKYTKTKINPLKIDGKIATYNSHSLEKPHDFISKTFFISQNQPQSQFIPLYSQQKDFLDNLKKATKEIERRLSPF